MYIYQGVTSQYARLTERKRYILRIVAGFIDYYFDAVMCSKRATYFTVYKEDWFCNLERPIFFQK